MRRKLVQEKEWFETDVRVQGRPQDLGGGGARIFFSDLGICMSRSNMLRMASPCALLGGFGGMLPRENFLKRCNLVRFRVYFDQILSLFFKKNAIFYIKNKYFRYTFVMGYFSWRNFWKPVTIDAFWCILWN